MAEPAEHDSQLEEPCRILNHFKLGYIGFGSHVARLNGLPWRRSTCISCPSASAW